MTVYAKPTQPRLAALRAQAMGGNDDDLPALDRRSRDPSIVAGNPLVAGQDVTVGGMPVTVLCPGRGRTTFCAGWIEDGQENYGTFFVSQIDP